MRKTIKENSKNYACSVVEIKGVFPIEEGQLYFGIKKPAKKKEW